MHLRATASVVMGTLVARRGCFLLVLFVAAVLRIAVVVAAIILVLLLARAELHEIHSRSARLAEVVGGALPHERSAQLDLANDVVDLGVAALVAIVRLRPRTMERVEGHFSDALEIDGVRHFGFGRPCFWILAIASVLLEVDVDRDNVVAFPHNRIMHITFIHPFLFGVHWLEAIEEELDRILAGRRCRARTKLSFRLLRRLLLQANVDRSEHGAGFGEASRATNSSGRHDCLVGCRAGRVLL